MTVSTGEESMPGGGHALRRFSAMFQLADHCVVVVFFIIIGIAEAGLLQRCVESLL